MNRMERDCFYSTTLNAPAQFFAFRKICLLIDTREYDSNIQLLVHNILGKYVHLILWFVFFSPFRRQHVQFPIILSKIFSIKSNVQLLFGKP